MKTFLQIMSVLFTILAMVALVCGDLEDIVLFCALDIKFYLYYLNVLIRERR